MLSHWEGSNSTLIRTIEPGSSENETLHDWFITSYKLDTMVCFLESVQEFVLGIPIIYVRPLYQGLKLLSILTFRQTVEKNSAKIAGARHYGFEVNHRSLQRFRSREDDNYKKVLFFIDEFVEGAGV